MNLLKKIDTYLEEYFLVATLIVMTILTLVQVMMRYLLGTSLTWSEEAVRYIFLWQVWVGVSFATKKSKHLRVEMLAAKLPPKGQKILAVIVYLIWLGFSLYMVYQSVTVVSGIMRLGQKSAALRIPMWIPNLSVTVGFSLTCYRLVQLIYGVIKPSKKEELDA